MSLLFYIALQLPFFNSDSKERGLMADPRHDSCVVWPFAMRLQSPLPLQSLPVPRGLRSLCRVVHEHVHRSPVPFCRSCGIFLLRDPTFIAISKVVTHERFLGPHGSFPKGTSWFFGYKWCLTPKLIFGHTTKFDAVTVDPNSEHWEWKTFCQYFF